MIKISNEVKQMIVDEENILNPILKAHTDYVMVMTAKNLDNAIMGKEKAKAAILKLKEWYAQANE